MSLFGKIVRTAINVVIGVPVALTQDILTLGGVATEQDKPYIAQKLQQIKDEAED